MKKTLLILLALMVILGFKFYTQGPAGIIVTKIPQLMEKACECDDLPEEYKNLVKTLKFNGKKFTKQERKIFAAQYKELKDHENNPLTYSDMAYMLLQAKEIEIKYQAI